MDSRSRRRVATLLSAVLAVSGFLTMLPVRLAAGRDEAQLASGRLLDGRGEPAHGSVLAYLEADGPERDGAAQIVATAASSPDGTYSLHLRPSPELLAAAAQNDGYLNLTLVGVTGDQITAVGISRRMTPAGRWAARRGEVGQDLRANLRMDAEQAAGAADLHRAVAEAALRSPGSATASHVPPQGWEFGCAWRVMQTTTASTVIGELHTWNDHTASFTYGQTADSDIAVAVSYDGGATYRLSGAVHIGNSRSNAVTRNAPSLFGKLLRSSFEYRKKHYWPASSKCYMPSYQIRAYAWVAGLTDGANVRHFDGRCATLHGQWDTLFGPDTSWTREDNNFVTFDGAVSVMGVSLTAQSGASSYVRVTHTFGSARSTHRVCGNDNYITKASRVFAG